MIRQDLNYRDYEKIFYDEMNSGRIITTMDGTEVLTVEDDEKWKQCYSPNDKARAQLPEFWFVSNRGNLISVATGKAYLLKKDDNGGHGRYSYHFVIKTGGDDNE